MAWQDEMTILLRNMINDVDETNYTYSDDRLETLLVVAGQLVIQDCGTFSQNFITDIENVAITPDPTDRINKTRDESFINLTCMKAACMTNLGEAKTAAAQGIEVKDQVGYMNLRWRMEGLTKLIDKSWCSIYQDLKLEYLNGTLLVGVAVLSPFRVFDSYNRSRGSISYDYPRS